MQPIISSDSSYADIIKARNHYGLTARKKDVLLAEIMKLQGTVAKNSSPTKVVKSKTPRAKKELEHSSESDEDKSESSEEEEEADVIDKSILSRYAKYRRGKVSLEHLIKEDDEEEEEEEDEEEEEE